ncbi:MAG: autotransporter outer membrane beta-barrel domain-containing protein [Pseudomonadota bacterium]
MGKATRGARATASLYGPFVAAALTLLTAVGAQAQSLSVGDGETLIGQQTVGDGSSVSVAPGGVIDNRTIVGGVDGISGGANVSVDNAGSIFAFEDAIELGPNGTVVNSGLLDGAFGIFAPDGLRVTNSGQINALGPAVLVNDAAVVVNTGRMISALGSAVEGDDDLRIENSGLMQAPIAIFVDDRLSLTNSGDVIGEFFGVVAFDDVSIVNDGTIQGGLFGVEVTNGEIVNRGSIIGVGDDAIVVFGPSRLINSGVIRGGGDGFDDDGDAANIVINSGIIASTGSGFDQNALDFGGGDDVLVLLPGSQLIGAVEFGDGADTLILGGALNTVVALDAQNLSGVFLPETLISNGLPAAFSGDGQLFAAVDPTALIALRDQFADFSDQLSKSVARRGADRDASAAGLTVSPMQYVASTGPRARKVWADAFGGVRIREAGAVLNEARTSWYGALAGAALGGAFGADLGGFIGVAGGASKARFSAPMGGDQTSHEITQLGPVVGLYADAARGPLKIAAQLSAGVNFYESDRRVAGLAGSETASMDFTGVYIAPEASLSTEFDTGAGLSLVPALTLGYAGAFLDGATEDSGSAPLRLDDRSIHLLRGRATLTAPLEVVAEQGVLRLSPRIGVSGYTGDGEAEGLLLGQSVDLTALGDDARATFFGGLGGEYSLFDSDSSAFFDIEAGRDTDSASTLSGHVGFRARF